MSDEGQRVVKFNQEHYDLLMTCAKKGDMTEWNEWYGKYKKAQKDAGKDDCGAWLDGAKMSGAHLKDANLFGAHLKDAELFGANLENADLSNADLKYAGLIAARLKDAGLIAAHLEDANLYNAVLQNACLRGAYLEGADMSCAILKGADMSCAILKGAKLCKANMEGADMSCAILKGAKLCKANMEGTNLSKANMEGAKLCKANLKRTDLSAANLKDANLSEANLKSAIVEWQQLNVADSLKLMTFPQIHISDKDLSKRDFSNSVLEGVTIENTNLKGTNFRFVRVDGNTLITGDPKKIIDDDTDFTGVGLSTARVDPKLRTRLERNIRKKHWEEWYDQHKILQYPCRLFWWLSDYGTSSTRCIGAFALLILAACVIYFFITGAAIADIPQLFADTILATFGFGSLFDQLTGPIRLLLAAHVLFGYFLLAVLITRFAVMFQSLTP